MHVPQAFLRFIEGFEGAVTVDPVVLTCALLGASMSVLSGPGVQPAAGRSLTQD